MKKRTSVRTVLGFFAPEQGNPSETIRAIRRAGARAILVRSDTTTAGSGGTLEKYSPLRLRGETMLGVRSRPESVRAVVDAFRNSGAIAVFVLRDPFDVVQQNTRTSHPEGKGVRWIPARLRAAELTFNAACSELDEAVLMEHALPPAAEWLLDNSYLLRAHVAEVRQHLPRHFSRARNGIGRNAELYQLACDWIRRTDCALTSANITAFLQEQQKENPFTISELWTFPLLLRMGLIETLTGLAVRVSRSQQLREAAYLWANRLATSARRGPDELQQMIRLMEAEPFSREPYFAVSLAEQLQDEEQALAALQVRIEERLNACLPDLAQAEHTREAAERISAAHAFGSLRLLSHLDFKEIFEKVSPVEALLRTDPAGIYPRSDFLTRDDCRHVVEQVAWYSGLSEVEVARRAIALAGANGMHVAYYLLSDGLKQLEAEVHTHPPFRTRLIRGVRRHATPVYLSAFAGLTACFVALALAIGREAGVHREVILAVLGVLAAFPLSELSLQIVNALVVSLLPPRRLPKMDFRDSIPEDCATLIVIPMMLSSVEVVRGELEKLEVRYLANSEPNLWFALLSDFTDSPDPTAPNDSIVIKAARDGIAALNQRHPGGRFLLFHRHRVWSDSEQRWIGRERKRGKLEDLNSFLCGEASGDILQVGRLPLPIRFVITLDADTHLPPAAARRMVETSAHPLNRVELDPVTRVRRRGFSIIQPRVSIALPDANATRFTRVFAEAYGTDPYSMTISDAQQDLFGEAIFHGKAIYDLRAFSGALANRFPAETLLSHDLIEGAHAGVGLATDIELFENLPHNYAAFSKREHRWIRGDWQIARWMAPSGNPLTMLNRWRILDNLRRSLVPIASLLLLLFGWLISAAPGVWTLVVGVAIAIPALAPLLDRGARHVQGLVQGWQGAADQLIRAAVMIAFLPHQAWLSMDAIVRANYRLHISRRKLLEWETSERSGAQAHHLNSTLRQMLVISACCCGLMLALEARSAFAPTILFVLLWALAPGLMLWLSQSPAAPRRLDKAGLLFLRQRARRTWRYFDDLVEQNNWLPPDNSQLALRVEVARRTSPTNIGLWLVSALAARDFGYITADDFLRRCAKTMETVAKLERYEGHLLNWYDTRTLEPLSPRYVSTVDSGNLLASLWVLAAGCRDVMNAPLIGPSAIRGLCDTLAVLTEVADRDLWLSVPLRQIRHLLHSSSAEHQLIGGLRLASTELRQLQEGQSWVSEKGDERAYWLSRLSGELASWNETAARYLHWVETLASPPDSFLRTVGDDVVRLRRRALTTMPSLAGLAGGSSLAVDAILVRRGLPELPPDAAAWLDVLHSEYEQARANAKDMVNQFDSLVAACTRLASEIDMRFLYDAGRRVFAVGYAVGAPLEFTSHYDLLASECRLASLVAIAKGDVPVEHWVALGRPRSSADAEPVLLSWSGTMFEYLMPLLFQRRYEGSLLDRACREAVDAQIAYGERKKIPWGVSESAYSALDAHQTYQYRAFGVPELALKRGLEDDMVVAPYATMLALMVDPLASIENLKRLEQLGLAGPMGLYESIDFARERKRDGERGLVIYTYMAHHQGMSLVSMDDVLHRDVMKRRFHSDLRIRAFESLLWERVPIVRQAQNQIVTRHAPIRKVISEEPDERSWKEPTRVPRVHLSGNGRYTLALTNSGAGCSRWGDFDITRWRSDPALESWGSFLYIRDLDSRETWAATPQPLGAALGTNTVTFSADRAEFRRTVSGIETRLDATVAAEDDIELRRLSVANRSLHKRTVELTSYIELAMAPHRADTAHPAFAKMFVETEYLGDGALMAHRRLRSPDDPPIWVAHVLIGPAGPLQYETDRSQFLGRARSLRSPQALDRDLTRTTGAVLDPIFSLRCRVKLEPRARVELSFLTLAASSREALLAMIAKYRGAESVARAFEMAWTRAQLEMRFLGVRPSSAHRFQALAGQLLYPNPGMRRIAKTRRGQSALWAYGISGDLPMITITTGDTRGTPLVRELLLAHAYWRLLGFRADLIILDQEPASYDQPLHQQLQQLIDAHAGNQGGVYLRDWNAIPEEDRNLILSASAVVLNGNRGPLPQQMVTGADAAQIAPFIPAGNPNEQPSPPLPFLELPYFNGMGGFHRDGREYAIYLESSRNTPAPWANVMANETFGTLVSESGLGFTWAVNSQANRLTPWHNDPVSDPQSEIIYLRDDESGALWTPTPLPIREKDPYRARHGQGYTVFEHNSHSIGQELTVFVPRADPVKIYRLRLRNDSSRARRLTVTYFAELVLGPVREDQQLHVQTAFDEASAAIFASQTWTGSTTGHIAFAASTPRTQSYTGDRSGFLGHNASVEKPAALDRARLDQRCGAGLDPAAALQISVTIPTAQHIDVLFLLGQADNEPAAREIIARYSGPDAADRALQQTSSEWDDFLTALQVRTPAPSADLLLNRWLPYQILSCRFWGRSATYQSGGAFGFRDQLQDSLALLYAAPAITRRHILASAARQFPEGDVQHWWHPDTGSGVRTRCSDDLLWLPYVAAHYIDVTGDRAILDESVPFLDGPALNPGEQERMFIPKISADQASLLDHCRRAIDHAWQLGPHGIPLIGSGDWNDGLNHVGVEGRGESVWLAWFFCAVLDSFAKVDPANTEKYRARRADLALAAERTSWDGEWYLRGFFDNGAPLGSRLNTEAQIDSLPQSWAVISEAADVLRSRRAMDSAELHLIDDHDRLVRLFTPPFDHSTPHPGYIMGYPPGVRENGGQYTHGSLWLAMARARMGDGDRAVRLLQMMNPIEHSSAPPACAKYMGEPYVSAADVYASPNRAGRAGWTWYTGSAAWMYRIWIEEVLGFKLRGDTLTIEPAMPSDWPGFEMCFRYRSSTYEITVVREDSLAESLRPIPLVDDGKVHRIRIPVPAQARRGETPALPKASPKVVPLLAPANGASSAKEKMRLQKG